MKGVIAFITVLLVMPLGHAATVLVLKLPHAWHLPMAAVGVLAAVIIIYLTKYSTSPARETFVGMLAGVLLWAALVEIGVHEGAEAINITERKAMEFSLAILIPLFILMAKLKWVSSYQALILPRLLHGFGLAFSIFLMRQYVAYVPDEIMDSARVDGCHEFRTYLSIVMPMVKSGVLVVGMIVFMDIWNDFMWPLIAVSKLDMYTVSLNIARLFGTQREVWWGQIMAACFMSSLPLIVIFLVFRRSFISGITAGAFK